MSGYTTLQQRKDTGRPEEKSSLTKALGVQSRPKDIILGTEKTPSMTAVIILVIPRIIYQIRMPLAHVLKTETSRFTHLQNNAFVFTGEPNKTNCFATNMSYRLPIFQAMSGITNIITAVMLNVFSMPRIMFFQMTE